GAPVRLDERHHHVDAAPAQSVRLLQHAVRLADSRGEAHVQLQPSAPGPLDQLEEVLGLTGARSALGDAHPSSYFRLFRHRVDTSSPRRRSRVSTAYCPATRGGRPSVPSRARFTTPTCTR